MQFFERCPHRLVSVRGRHARSSALRRLHLIGCQLLFGHSSLVPIKVSFQFRIVVLGFILVNKRFLHAK